MHDLKGGCHCGNISVEYRTVIAPEDAEPRACQCSFCRKHQSRAISDPAGRLTFLVNNSDGINRYGFGARSCDFLICRNCGVYVGAYMPDPDDASGFGTLMANALDDQALYGPGQSTDYDGEDGRGKRERRRLVWTPAEVKTVG